MLRWLEPESGEKDENLDQRKAVQDKIKKIVNSTEKLEYLKNSRSEQDHGYLAYQTRQNHSWYTCRAKGEKVGSGGACSP